MQGITAVDNAKQGDAFVKVKADRIEKLMDMVGELSLVAEELVHHQQIVDLELEEFDNTAHRMNSLIRELQDETSSLRLVPISSIFAKMQRLVRDLIKQTGKSIDYQTRGEETEIDKLVVESLSEPLVHMIRNAIDHGIESPEERRDMGKSEKGSVNLVAAQQGGEIVITIEDDGKGIDREAVLNKAINKGLVQENEQLTDKEVYALLFEPGFSTRNEVSKLSGRGVGMDVVKSTITNLRGRIDVSSTLGKGSIFRLIIPLSLAFLDTLVVAVGDKFYAFAIENIDEVFEVEKHHIVHCSAEQSISLKVREDIISVCSLDNFYQNKSAQVEAGQVVVLVEAQEKKVAIPIDEICGQFQVTIKKLQGQLRHIRAASGCALLPNGDVAILMDCLELTDLDNKH